MDKRFSKESAKIISIGRAVEDTDTVKDQPRRRIQDSITSKNPTRKMNLDRRCNSERRSSKDSDYDGLPRRYTIERRMTSKDRRIKENP